MIPNDPIMLLSFINTRLRDQYSSLDALCDDLDVDKKQIINTLKSVGYIYSPQKNQFT